MPPRSARFPRARLRDRDAAAAIARAIVCEGSGERHSPVDGFAKGEPKSPFRSKPVPTHRSWSRARQPWTRIAQGARPAPLRDGSRESSSLPRSGCNAETLPSAAKGSMPTAADRIPCRIGRHKDGLIGSRDALKGVRGEPESSPGKVSAVVPRTPCTKPYCGFAPLYDYAMRQGHK